MDTLEWMDWSATERGTDAQWAAGEKSSRPFDIETEPTVHFGEPDTGPSVQESHVSVTFRK